MPRPIPIQVGSWDISVVHCVIARTKTRSKKSSSGMTRSPWRKVARSRVGRVLVADSIDRSLQAAWVRVERMGAVGKWWFVAALAAGCLLSPSGASAASSVSVAGNHLVDGGKPIRLIGVNRSGSEYACAGPVGGGGFGYGVFQGPVSNRTIKAMLGWRINAVALPLNEACWLGGYAPISPRFSGAAYRAAILDYVSRLNARGIIVVLRLSGAAPGAGAYGMSTRATDEIPMADADHALDFWRSVATTFRDDHQVIFHAFDEPNAIDWPCALNGCAANDAPAGQAPVRRLHGGGSSGDRRRDPLDRGYAAHRHLRDRLRREARPVGAVHPDGSARPARGRVQHLRLQPELRFLQG